MQIAFPMSQELDNRGNLEFTIKRSLILLFLLLVPSSLFADPVPVRFSQGTSHAFLSIRDLNSVLIGTGELVQVAHGDRVTIHVTLRFRDGSLDDETTIYTQRNTFQLVSDHHVQRGPSYPNPLELVIKANGQVTIHDLSSPEGKTTTAHFDLPTDTYNGLYFIVLANLSPRIPETKVAMLAPSRKGRLVQLSIKPDGEDVYTVGALRRKATIFRIHFELGGVTGIVAPLVGKQPDDMRVWVSGGDAPTVVKGEAQLYEGGPVWRIELVSPAWPKETSAKR